MAKPKFQKPHLVKSPIKKLLEQISSVRELDSDDSFLISFKHLDRNQGSNFYDWEKNSMLGLTIDTLSSYCNRPLLEQCDGKKFTIYGSFPPKSNFTHPKHVPEDANWARIHINGLHVVAGHIYRNTFYVVFLDHDHTFYRTEN